MDGRIKENDNLMEEKIKKPIMLAREDLINTLTKEINESGLPPFIIEPILQSFLAETKKAMRRQYEIEKQQYEDALDFEKSKKK